MTVDEVLDDFRRDFERRRYSAGLLLAFIGFLRELGAFGRGFEDIDAFLTVFPLSDVSVRGGRANTLTVEVAGDGGPHLVSIRPAYNAAETFFRVTHKRFDYPNCAPHATGQWRDYWHWLDALVGVSEEDADRAEEAVKEHVLGALESHEIDPSQLPPLERPFTRLLEEFDLSRHGREPAGAAFQGAVYAYIRADAPHLHLDVAKVGAGSKRLGRVGDIDGWEGERLVLSVEVKHLSVDEREAEQVLPFLTEVAHRDALAIVAAVTFADAARDRIAELGGRPLDVPDLLSLVDLWDPLKQRAALMAFVYYVHHIEKRKPLMTRVQAFLDAPDAGPAVDIPH